MVKQMKIILGVALFAFFIAVPSNITFAQDSLNTNSSDSTNMNTNSARPSSFSEKHAKELQMRLNLSDEQTTQVKNILTTYEATAQNSTPANKDNATMRTPGQAQAAASDQIAGILDSNQKTQFDQIKDQWWANVTQDIGGTKMDKQNNSY